jgi:hypothetical protein
MERTPESLFPRGRRNLAALIAMTIVVIALRSPDDLVPLAVALLAALLFLRSSDGHPREPEDR